MNGTAKMSYVPWVDSKPMSRFTYCFGAGGARNSVAVSRNEMRYTSNKSVD
jgi:hypothetical protein